MKMIISLSIIITAVIMFAGCADENISQMMSSQQDTLPQSEIQREYEQLTQEEAQKIMDTRDDIIILDVRTQEEYDEGHIPGSICIPNETITEDNIKELSDKDQIILVYCRSGRRSKLASEKLASYGYTNIKEFGGIIDWQGEIEK